MSIRIDDVILDDDASKAALSGTSGNLRLGGNGVDGDVLLFPSEGDLSNNNSSTFHLDANGGNLWMGGNGKDGDLVIFPANASSNNDTGDATFHFDGDGGNLWMGGNGKDGDLVIFPANASNNHDTGDATFHFDGDGGNLWIGGNGTDGDILLFSSSVTDNHDTSEASIHLDANAGDITVRNTGVAEEFAIAESVDVLPGSVMVLDKNGLLQPSEVAYDKRVVGIISGAGHYKPGLVLDKQVGKRHRSPIAMTGKAYCLVTAKNSPIQVGDLLTTADIPGHAMKAKDTQKAFGAVIGKALAPLEHGTGLIPMLVALQ
ncbi:hypothetical protein MNBD_GAMMA19-2098 [hydrothermal vent metagenome]|uniref:Uncharacterized protein n=1 Tax=hydrothermal vent metagenome TaxID=652676 RepID=A0A3B1APA2_9ZZZZ